MSEFHQKALAIDSVGDLLIVDRDNHCIVVMRLGSGMSGVASKTSSDCEPPTKSQVTRTIARMH
jgi:hypothetical protein